MAKKKPKPDTGGAKREPTERERTALRGYLDRRAAQPAPRIRVSKDGSTTTITPDHPDKTIGHVLLAEAIGTTDGDFLNGLLRQLVNAGSQGGEVDEAGLNFMLAVVKDVKPKDQLEAMLAAQMAAVHMATMTFARRLAHVDNIAQQDSAERAFNKLARTFATQMEALKRYRTGGEQRVTVQHVSVSQGGQAIVGNVSQAARERAPESQKNSAPALTDARQPAMTILGDGRERVPVELRRGKKDGGRSSA